MSAATEPIRGARAHTRYKLADGTRVPGATTVLGVLAKPALIKWANDLGLDGIDSSRYVDALARIGTLAHQLIEQDLGGPAVVADEWTADEFDRAENALLSYRDWRRGHEIEPMLIEESLLSETMRYGGTVDCFASVDGVPTLLDFKTSKAIYEEHILQVAAYERLLREHGYTAANVRVLQVGRSPDEGFTERVLPVEHLDPYFAVFNHALAIYWLQKQIKRGAA